MNICSCPELSPASLLFIMPVDPTAMPTCRLTTSGRSGTSWQRSTTHMLFDSFTRFRCAHLLLSKTPVEMHARKCLCEPAHAHRLSDWDFCARVTIPLSPLLHAAGSAPAWSASSAGAGQQHLNTSLAAG